MKEFELQQVQSAISIDRRTFIKGSLTTATALVGSSILNGEPEQRHLEKLPGEDILISTPSLKLKLSEYVPGIVDIYDRNGLLVNNLVPIVRWVDESSQNFSFNNPEIQKIKIEAFRDKQRATTILRYPFTQGEFDPNLGIYPAANVTTEIQITKNEDGSINLKPVITRARKKLNSLVIGMGCFYGLNHGTMQVKVETKQGAIIARTIELQHSTTYGRPDETYSISDESYGFSLISVYKNMPLVTLSTEKPNPLLAALFPQSTSATTVIGLRDNPWSQSQNGLYRPLTQETGRKEWIESAILYSRKPFPTYTLQLNS